MFACYCWLYPYTQRCTLHTCHVCLLLLTEPIYTTLYTTHMPCLLAIVDCTHIHNVVHYTHAMSACYCWLHPYTQRCTLHTCHVCLLLLTVPIYTTCTLHTCHVCLLLLTVSIYTTLYTTHMPCLLAIVDCIHIHNVVHYTHAMSACYCWLSPYTQRCTLHTCHVCLLLLTVPIYTTLYTTHMPCLLAIVDCTHIHNVIHYTHAMSACYCWLYPYTQRCTLHTCHVCLLLLTVSIYTTLYTTHMPCLLAIVDCTHIHNVIHYTHAMSACYCWLYPYTQRCTLHTCHVCLLLLTVPIYTTLYTTHMPCLLAIVDCIHIHNVVHYTHAMSACYCWLYPYTQRCTLHTCHVYLLLLTVSIYTTLYTTHMPCLLAIVDCVHIHNVVHYTHAMSACYCWLYPYTQRCTLHTCHVCLLLLTVPIYTTLYTTHMPCLLAIVDCIHIHNVVHYTHAMSACYCWLYPYTQRCTLHTCHVCLLLLTVSIYTTLYTTHMPCLLAIVDCTHIHNVVHYTHAMSACYCWLSHIHNVIHYTYAMSACYCWLCPYTQRCTLHTCHVCLLLLTVSIYTTLYTTHMPCLLAIVDCIHIHNVVHYTHAMSACYCWLYPYTQRCTLHTCHVCFLLLTVPIYTTLYTTHMPCLLAIVDCTHIHNVVHYTHAMSACYCWLYPYTQRYTLHTCHVCLLLLTVSIYTTLYTTHMPCLLAIVDCTHIHNVVHYTHVMSACYCWLCPYTQRCTLHTCHVCLLLLTVPIYTTLYTTHMPCLLAIVDWTHIHNVVHYTHAMSACYCWLCPYTQRCTLHTCHVCLLLLTVSIYTTLYTTHMPCLLAIVDWTHIHNVVHYTHAMSAFYCWLYPYTQRCTLHTCHVCLLLLTVPIYTTLYTTHMPCLLAIVDCIYIHNVVHYTHAMSPCYCWLCPYTQRCTLHTCHVCLLLLTVPIYTLYTTHMPCLLAIVDCNHIHNVVHYTHAMSACYCWLYPYTQRCTLHTCHVCLLLLTVPIYTTLYTTHMPCLLAIVDCTHIHVVHYTHAMSACYCWLYPYTQRCTLHTCHVCLLLLTVPIYTTLYTTHMPCLLAIVDCIHIHNVVHYTHAMSTCYCWLSIYTTLYTTHMPCLLAIVDCTHIHNVVHYTHAMSACYCWLYPYTRCTLHTCHVYLLLLTVSIYTTLYTTHMPCLLAIVDCTHIHNVVHYTHAMSACYCWLYPYTQRCTLHTCHVCLLLLTVPYTQRCTLHTCHVCLLLLTVPIYTLYTTHMPCLLAIVDCTHIQRCTLHTCHVSLLLLTVPIYTLYTTHMPCLLAIVDCVHIHNVVHYTHAMSACYCWLYPYTQRCTLHTCHVCLLLLTVPIYTTLYTTYMPCLLAIVDCTHIHNVVHYIHAMSTCYCWLYPYTQRCTLHTCHVCLLLLTVPIYTTLYTTHMPCLLAIVDCTHIHNVVHYTHVMSACYCWLYPYTQRCTLHTCHVCLLLLTVPIYTTLYTTHMPCLLAIVDCTHIHNVVHYTHATACYCWLYPYTQRCTLHTCHSACYCWLYPYTQRCTLHTCHVSLLLLTVSIYTTLYTTHMPCLLAIVDCVHIHNVVHYTHAMSACYCWLYPYTQRCTLHTCHVCLLLLTVPIYTTLYTTHMSCLLAIVDCTHIHNVVHYTHAMSACYCWLYPYTQRCTLHTCHVCLLLLTVPIYTTLYTTHMPCLLAIVDCIHIHNVVHYTHVMSACYCWLYPYTQRCTLHTCHVCLLLLTVPIYTTLYTTHMPCLLAIVDCTHIHNVVHYTHAMSAFYCWLYPYTQRCTLHTCHVCLLLLTVSIYTTLYTYTHAMSACYCWLSPYTQRCTLHTCHVCLLLLTVSIYTTLYTTHMPCLLAIVDWTHIHNVVHYTHAMSACYCWLYECTRN